MSNNCKALIQEVTFKFDLVMGSCHRAATLECCSPEDKMEIREKIENFMTAVVHFFGAAFNTVQILYRKNLMDIVMMVEKDREVTRSKVKIAYKAMEEATKTPEKKKIKEKNKEEEEEEELKEWVDNTFTCQSISYIPHYEEEDKMDFLVPGLAEEVSVEAGPPEQEPQ